MKHTFNESKTFVVDVATGNAVYGSKHIPLPWKVDAEDIEVTYNVIGYTDSGSMYGGSDQLGHPPEVDFDCHYVGVIGYKYAPTRTVPVNNEVGKWLFEQFYDDLMEEAAQEIKGS